MIYISHQQKACFKTGVLISLTLLNIGAVLSVGGSAWSVPIAPRQRHGKTRSNSKVTLTTAQRKKIRIDLSRIDSYGLWGADDGKVSMDYMFAIPHAKRCRDQVHRIDPTITFLPQGSRRASGQKEE